jgi:hypothetical protein
MVSKKKKTKLQLGASSPTDEFVTNSLLTDIYSSLKNLRYDQNAVSKSLAPLQAVSDKQTEISKTTMT